MPILFRSDKDCGEILELFRERCETKAPQPQGKYFVEYSPEESGYVYTDSSEILSSREISEMARDYDSVTQLSFEDMNSEQLSFTDVENKNEDEK